MPPSVRAKLDWAKKHLDTFKVLTSGFVKDQAYVIDREIQSNGSRDVYRYRDLGWMQPPELPLVVGDCIQNIRSSLDHLVFHFVAQAHDVTKFRKGQFRQSAFLITSLSTHFDNARERHKVIPDDVWTTMRGFQRYNGGDTELLHILDNLAVIDKHRRLNVVAAAVSKINLLPWFQQTTGTGSINWHTGPLEDGAEVCSITNPDLEVDFREHFDIALSVHDIFPPVPAAVVPLLEAILGYTETRVVPAFL